MRLPVKVRMLNVLRKVFQLPVLEAWLARLTSGKPPDHFFCKFVPNPYQYEKPALREVIVDGIRMSVDVSDYVGHYYFFGFKDLAQRNLFSLCKEHFNVLDVGANIGFTILKLAKEARHGIVIGFEPDPFNFSCCSHNLSLNNLNNAFVQNVALGSMDAELDMEIRFSGNRGGHRISRSGLSSGKVNVRKLDGIFPHFKMDHLDLVKIDVEGYELRVLKGAEITLRKFKPLLFIEIDNDNLLDQGDSAEELINFLYSLGYESILNADTKRPLAQPHDFTHCHFDIIAR